MNNLTFKTTCMKKLLLLFAFISTIFAVSAQTDLIISEYVEGWSNNKALEIFNPTDAAINLSAYRVTRYSNGSDVPPADDQWTIALPDFSLEAYKSYVLVLDKRDPEGSGQEAPIWVQLEERADVFLCPDYNTSKSLYFNGDDGVALEKTDGTLVDLFARWGAPRPAEANVGGSDLLLRCWTDNAPHFDGTGVGITADHTMVKKSSINAGVIANPTIWNPMTDWDTLPANTFSNLGWHKSDVSPTNETPVFDQSSYIYSVASTSDNELLIGTLTTTDTENDAVKYYINYGNFVYIGEGDAAVRIEPFAIGKTDGKLTLVDKLGLDPVAKDTFDIKVVATDGFSQTEEVLVRVLIDIEIGISEISLKNEMKLWPNPTMNNSFSIVANKNIDKIVVTNVIGQEIFTQKNVNARTSSINMLDANKGIYIVTAIMIDNSTSTTKVIFK